MSIVCYRCQQEYRDGACGCRDGITLVHGDCRAILPLLPSGGVDLVLTDPPYGICDRPQIREPDNPKHQRKGRPTITNTWHPESDWDKVFPAGAAIVIREVCDVVAWFGHWKKRYDAEENLSMPLRAEIIWAKDTHVGPPCPAAMQDERLWIFSREALEPRCFETTVWFESIIPTWSYRRHKNEKPVALMRRALRWLPGDSVCDPFAGSGTTGRAAKDLGRKCVMIEIEEKYCQIAANRLKQEVLAFTE